MHQTIVGFCVFQRQTATNISFEEAREMCDDHFQTCPGTAAKDSVETDYNTTLDNCAQDVMVKHGPFSLV